MVTVTQAFDRFAELVLPGQLPPCARQRFEALARFGHLAKDGSLDFKARGEQIVFVVGGATKLVAHASESRDQVIAFHFPGEMFTVPGPANYSYSVCALRDCDLFTFGLPEFVRLAAGEDAIMQRLLESTKLSLLRSREKTIALGRKTAGERVAVFLLSMAGRIGVEQDGMISLELPMSRRDISESLGLTIETVSRQLSKLKDAGAIETAGRSGIILRDCAALQCRAGFLRDAA